MASVTRTLLRRGYATAAPSIKAPLQINTLTGTYATSTYLAALKKSPKELETLAKDIRAFDKKITDDPKLADFLNNPTLSASERDSALTSLVPSGSSPILLNLLKVLSDNGRLASTQKVFADFDLLLDAYNGVLDVTVTSAEALDAKSLSRIEKALKGTEIAQGKTLKITNKVNADVLGGFLVDLGDKTIDLSASAKVSRFNAAINQAI